MAVTTINIDSQVLTFANLAAFPVTGTVKTIYIAEDTNFQYYWDGSQYVLLTTDINIPANLIFYATTAPSSVAGYEKLVISPDDPDYDNPAVDVPTGAITTTAQLVGEQIADANIFAGNPGVINISTIGEIRRTSGTGTAEFYFEIYQRTSLGVETLIGTSNKTAPISGGVYQQFQVDCLFNNGTWLTTDRVVIKFYADRVAGGSNPNYDFLFGGANPVRTLFPISAQLLLNVPIAIGITGVTGGIANEVLLTDGSGKLGQSELKTVNSNSLLGSGDVSVGTVTSIATAGLLSGGTITSSGTITTSINTNRLVGRSTAGVGVMEEITIGSGLTLSGGTLTAAGGSGITIGTTAIASGTIGRLLFQGTGDVVQQSANLFWDNTNSRLALGTSSPIASTRLTIFGSVSSISTFGLQVHNATGTNNALVVADNGHIGINNLPNATYRTIFNYGTNALLGIYSPASGVVRIDPVNNAASSVTELRINGNPLVFLGNATEYGRISTTEIRFQSLPFNINRQQLSGGETSILNLNNTGSQANATLTQTYNINTTTPYVQLKGTVGSLNVSASFYNIHVRNKASTTLVEVMRFTGNGNVTIGGVDDNNDNTTKTLIVNNGVAPASNVTDSFQQYSADIVAGNAAPHFRTENGDVVRLYRVGGWGLPTGSFTRTTFDTTTVTLQQLAERVAALIQDLRDNHQLLKA